MERLIDKKLEKVRESVIKMATLVEEAVQKSTSAFQKRDIESAQSVIQNDSQINEAEIAIDKEIFEFLALNQPVAGDLRFLFSVQKMNKDMERIGDHAVNVAQSAINCASLFGPAGAGQQLNVMISIARQMLAEALTSFSSNDSQLALKVLEQDDQVDDLNWTVTRDMIDMVKKDATSIEIALEIIRISKNLERIADLSTNIAEDVIFNTKALDVKHTPKGQAGDRQAFGN